MGQCYTRESVGYQTTDMLLRTRQLQDCVKIAQPVYLRIYALFRKLAHKEEFVPLHVLAKKFAANKTPFEMKYWDIYRNHPFGLTFEAFLTAVWNLCSRNNKDLAFLLFHVTEDIGNGLIDEDSISELLRQLHTPKGYSEDVRIHVPTINKATQTQEVNGSVGNFINAKQFVSLFYHQAITLLRPIVRFRNKVMKEVVDPHYWTTLQDILSQKSNSSMRPNASERMGILEVLARGASAQMPVRKLHGRHLRRCFEDDWVDSKEPFPLMEGVNDSFEMSDDEDGHFRKSSVSNRHDGASGTHKKRRQSHAAHDSPLTAPAKPAKRSSVHRRRSSVGVKAAKQVVQRRSTIGSAVVGKNLVGQLSLKEAESEEVPDGLPSS